MVRPVSSLILASLLVALTLVGAPVPRADAQTCVAPPSGMVSWYTMDGFLNDRMGANNPSSVNNVSFVAGTVGPVVALVKVIPDDPVAFQAPHTFGGVPASGVITAVIVPLGPDPMAYGFCPFTEIVVRRQNAGDSGA